MIWTTALALTISFVSAGASPPPVAPDFAWWTEARFGMFVHWGLYSEAGSVWKGKFLPGWSEWMLNRKKIPPDEYHAELTPRFDPVDFDADAWVRAAKDAGMKYIVITTKHHEGFALWPSAAGEQDIATTHFGKPKSQGGRERDPLRELADACKRHGIKLGFYYSLLDWSHPDYLPRREWDTRSIDGAEYPRYTTYMRAQVKELLDGRYGEIAVLWGDGDWEHGAREHTSDEIVAMARELQPGILINDRWSQPGDYATPENKIPDAGPARPWETCMTLNNSWGYARDDHEFKSAAAVLRNLADIVSKGGNYLLNIGPDGKGRIDPESMSVLSSIALWMKTHSTSIHGNGRAPLPVPEWGKWTMAQSDEGTATLNAHLFSAPKGGVIQLAGVMDEPLSIRVPGNEFAVGKDSVRRDGADLLVQLDAEALEAIGKASTVDTTPHAVIEVEFASMPRVLTAPEILGDDSIFVDGIVLRLSPPPAGAVIHVTTNGSMPTLLTPPLVRDGQRGYSVALTRSATVRARASWNGQLSSAETTRRVDQVELLSASVCDALGAGAESGLTAKILLGEFEVVPGSKDFDAVIDLARVDSIRIPENAPLDRYAVQIRGVIETRLPGVYRFEISSDDGSELWIDGRLVIDNGGLHGATSKFGDIALAGGCHEIEVRMFESVGGEALSLRWRVPFESDFTAIPAKAFRRSLGQ